MRVDGASSAIDLFRLFQSLQADRALDPALLDQLVLGQTAPELFSGHSMTGAVPVGLQTGNRAGMPLHQTEFAHQVTMDRRARDDLAARSTSMQRVQALIEGPFDRAEIEKAIRELFNQLAQQGLPLEPRPGSVLAEAFATGDFSQLENGELMQLLVLLALYGQNRHRPNSVAQQPNAGMAPRGTWGPGGVNNAGGGNQHTGMNRAADPVTGPTPPAGDIPPGTAIGQRLATTARRVANEMNSTGWCFKGVANAVAQATGVQLSGRSAYMAADQLAASDRFQEVQVSPDQLTELPPGAVVVWGRTDASPHGHISVALGNGQEASDHVQSQITSLRGASNYRVFVPRE